MHPLILIVAMFAPAKKPESHLKQVPTDKLAMTCTYDQWTRLSNGEIRYTYMTCEDQQGNKSQWMRVPDHSTSMPLGGITNATPVIIPMHPIVVPESRPADLPSQTNADDAPDSSSQPKEK